MIKLLIFDLDGTLVNAYPAIIQSVNYTLDQLGLPHRSDTAIKKAVGHGDRQLMAHFVGEELSLKALKFYRAHHLKALKTGVSFLPGAKEILPWAQSEGVRLAIASNRPTKFTKVILKSLHADVYFDMVLCADKASRPKPYPDMLKAICKKLKVKKAQCIYIGDMTIDIQCGVSAGIKTIAVATGSNTKNELKESSPYKIINYISQLKQLFKEGEL